MTANLSPAHIADDAAYAAQPAALSALAARLISGGDDRLDLLPETSRNEYGTPPLPTLDEVWLSSSTASAISVRGYDAVAQIDRTLGQKGRWTDSGIAALCVSVRSRLNTLFGIDGSKVILTPSGTDAELLMLGIVERGSGEPITNIVIAPKESGSGVVLACGGHHFRGRTCLDIDVPKGERIAGWEDADLATVAVDLRGLDGNVRRPDSVESEIAERATEALEQGRRVILHVLDTSKTGLQICTRGVASRLMRDAPGRVHVMVDSCQLRCDPAQIRDDLTRGFAVIVTGSKFAGGPPFSGALLLPSALADKISELPAGFRDYTTTHDWPAALRHALPEEADRHNPGAPMRWVAALTELDALQSVDSDIAAKIIAHFDAELRRRAEEITFARPLFTEDDTTPRACSIVPLIAYGDAKPLTMAQARDLHRALRTPLSTPEGMAMQRIVNIGQPVAVGERVALRICIDAPRIIDIATRLAEGRTMAVAFAETDADLDAVFAKWTALVEGKV